MKQQKTGRRREFLGYMHGDGRRRMKIVRAVRRCAIARRKSGD